MVQQISESPANASIRPVRYSPSLEQVAPDEDETSRELNETLHGILETTSKDYDHAVRSVHAKAHGILHGTLEVTGGLPEVFAQGLFARPGSYDAVLRISTNPGDILDDSVSVPRGAALKIAGVGSPSGSQDFVMVDGPAFAAPEPKKFLGNLKMLAGTTDKAEGMKKALSAVLRTAEAALEAVGGQSAMLTTLGGAPPTHPLGLTYYTQVPFRYGDYVAKFSLAPVSPHLKDLTGDKVNVTARPDALREVVSETMIEQDAVWDLCVQLCTDLEKMPIEDASVAWDEKESPYVPVARLTVPHQQSWVPGESEREEDALLFTPWHCLDEHRPLGGINRARKSAYEMSSQFRAQFNGCPIHEPRGPDA